MYLQAKQQLQSRRIIRKGIVDAGPQTSDGNKVRITASVFGKGVKIPAGQVYPYRSDMLDMKIFCVTKRNVIQLDESARFEEVIG